jgi:hypothetical protein
LALLLGPAVGIAQAVTPRDLVELARAGLGDDVLIALIASDGSVFHLSAQDVKSLHAQGLSDKVIVVMINTAIPPAPSEPAEAPVAQPEPPPAPDQSAIVTTSAAEPGFYVADGQSPITASPFVTGAFVVQSPVTPPAAPVVTVPIVVASPRRHDDRRTTISPPPSPPASPIYWGWGGQLRPGSWDPTSGHSQTPKKSGGGH